MSEPRKIWRAKIHAAELLSCGFDPRDDEKGWAVIKGILKAKGVPDWCTKEGQEFRCDEVEGGILVEFEG